MEQKSLKQCCKQIRGVSYKPSDLHNILNDSSIILLRANNISDFTINYDDIVFVDKKRVSENQILRKGDILICASSGSKALVGKAALFQDDVVCTFGAFCKVVRPQLVSSEYLAAYFQSPVYRRTIAQKALGANINNIRNEHIDELILRIYDKEKEKQIVDTVIRLNALIDYYHKTLDKLELLIKSRFIEVFGDPVSNPKKWEKRPLSEEAEIKIGPFGSLLHKDDYITDGHALVNPSHILNGKIVTDCNLTVSDEKYAELSAYHLNEGDVILGRRGEMGRCAVVDQSGLLCGTGSLLIRSKGDLSPDYIQKIISFPSFKRTIEDMAVGQTMPNLNVPIVSSFSIIKPPKDVQAQYYNFVGQIDKSKSVVQKSLDEAQLLFDSLMQEFFG